MFKEKLLQIRFIKYIYNVAKFMWNGCCKECNDCNCK